MTMTAIQKEKANRFRQLHMTPPILVLPNAWDAASARVLEQAGFPAIATTSSGVAAALGYPDGQHISRHMLIEVVERITRVVSCPVTVDLEAGYGNTIEEVLQTVRAVIEAGAVGINLEDSSDAQLIADLVKAIHGPINIMAGPSTPTMPELERLGVARASLASGLMRAALGRLRRVVQELLESGTYRSLSEDAFSGVELRNLFKS